MFSSSAHAPRNRRMSSSPILTDYLKLVVLCALTALCCYSAVEKFIVPMATANATSKPHINLKVDYRVCQQAVVRLQQKAPADLQQKCQLDIQQAFSQAKLLCHGYINVADRCLQSGKDCSSERRNVDSCMDSQLQERHQYWEHYQGQ